MNRRKDNVKTVYLPYTVWGGGGGGGGGIKMKITLNYPKSATMGFFQELKNKFETAVVDEGVLLYI